MTNDTQFKVWRVEEQEGDYRGSERPLDIKELPAGDVLIKVSHSSLNYKDALSASGNKGVTRSFPPTPLAKLSNPPLEHLPLAAKSL